MQTGPAMQRCLFSNGCVAIRLLGVPCGGCPLACPMSRAGLVVVTEGSLELSCNGKQQTLGPGDSAQVESGTEAVLSSDGGADVVLFERLDK